jgi:hypothetical protein
MKRFAEIHGRARAWQDLGLAQESVRSTEGAEAQF